MKNIFFLLYIIPIIGFGQLTFDPPKSGKYDTELILSPVENVQIKYSTTGIIPNKQLTTDLIISTNTSITFSIKSTSIDTIFNRVYLFNITSKFPIVALAIEPEDLWNDTTGIYTRGRKAIYNDSTGHWDSCNYQRNWEKQLYVTYITAENSIGFSQRAGIKIFGESTRRQPDKSLKIIARKKYGKGKFGYPIFDQKSIKKFKQLVIRTSGNDFNSTRFKDVLSTHLVAPLGLDYMAYQPIQLYVNGKHWGLYNLREKVNEHYIAENYKIHKDSVNIIMGRWVVQKGNSSYYRAMYRFFENVETMTDQNYAIAQQFLDIRNYINYRVFQIYINNKDSRGNIRYWNANGYQQKFKMIVYDTDLGYGNPDYNYLKACLSPVETNWHNPTWSTMYLRKLMQNQSFKNEFINQFAHLLNTTLNKDSVISQIDYLQMLYYGELPMDKSLRPSHLKGVLFPFEKWNKDVEELRDFTVKRSSFILAHLLDVFNLEGTYELVIKGEHGRLVIQENTPQKMPFKGIYFKNIPLEIIALNSEGYKFKHWSDGDTNKTKIINQGGDYMELTATYLEDASTKTEAFEKYNATTALDYSSKSSGEKSNSILNYINPFLTLENLAYLLLSLGLTLLIIYFIWK